MPVWVGAFILGSAAASIRWLRVAQREHYLPPATSRFAWRWWRSSTLNGVLGALAASGVAASFFFGPSLSLLGLLAVAAPFGLSWRGKTSALVWTPRLRRLAAGMGVLVLLLAIWSVLINHPGPIAAAVVVLPRLVDAAAALLAPLEKRLGDRWVEKARSRLRASGARVVAITGSYGKTTTKTYLTHLLGGLLPTVASPASFNNRLGLARAINEQINSGTAIFVAEMGTYGPGEIRELCQFVSPEVAVITAIGPVHLERFGSEEKIVAAKSEILERARVAVLNIDHPLLADLASRMTQEVLTCSERDPHAKVSVIEGWLRVEGADIARVSPEVFAGNLACAFAAALALGLPADRLADRLAELPTAHHRRQVQTSDRGVTIIDDTYNSNPSGARAALATLLRIEGGGRKVVITPGMVELGHRQEDENREWGRVAAEQATDLLVVGQTNRRALQEGAAGRRALVTVVGSRPEAVSWVRENLEAGDAVLYENDLPDHYP